MKIGQSEIGTGRTFVIAEIGNNHNGSIERAIELIDIAYDAGADAVKFQMRHIDQIYRKRTLLKKGEDLGTEYVLDLLRKFELNIDEHRKISEYCNHKRVFYFCTPWDPLSIKVLESFGVMAYKVASADLTNIPLIDQLIQTGKPIIISTGMSLSEEVKITVAYLQKRDVEFAILHCNSTYPAPFQDINLKWINSLRKLHHHVGYSGHERGISVSLAAVAMGAEIIERHITLDRGMEGPDHAASLTPIEFKMLVSGIREIEDALGDGQTRKLSQGEMINRENLGKSLVANTAIKKGTIIKSTHIKVMSPGQGLSPQRYEELLGKKTHRDINEEDFFYESDITNKRTVPKNYNFIRPWGIPVRYHDFNEYALKIKPNIWEFHLSYSDMELEPGNYLKNKYNEDFIVHAPELFAGSHLMDLASPDSKHQSQSIRETQRVIDITRKLKKYFPNTKKPLIVANIGGFSMDESLPLKEIQIYYERFAKSLDKLDLEGVELIPQSMAPFPWHFGGQRYQNLFVRIEEIKHWCNILRLRVCFDVSHSFLTCNYLKYDFYKFSREIAPFTAHLHIGDAKGLNGEGLQLGEGQIDFDKLASILRDLCPKASFIPEIWQGHKNGGEGFWNALEQLEGKL
jgi:N-acetylneuraminate synthase